MIIDAKVISAMLVTAGKNDTRHYLNSLHFDDKGYIVSTDGSRMGIYKVAHDLPTVTIPRDAFSHCKKGEVEITIEKDMATVCCGGLRQVVKLIDTKFPEWRRAFVNERRDDPMPADMSYAAEYLADFGKIEKLLGAKYPAPKYRYNAGHGSARVELPRSAEYVGVLMSCRIYEKNKPETCATWGV